MVELSVRGPCWVKGAQCSGFNGFFSSGAVREMLRCRGLQASLAGGRKGEDIESGKMTHTIQVDSNLDLGSDGNSSSLRVGDGRLLRHPTLV